jgi:hypothetical protein
LTAGIIGSSASNLILTEGQTFNGIVGTFTDSNTGLAASSFTAMIQWGDGVTDTGTVTGGSGSFSVSGSHIYDEGGFILGLTIMGDGSTVNPMGSSTVADAPLGVNGVNPTFLFTPGVARMVTIGNFTEPNPFETASDFSAQITWGDGVIDTAVISGSPSGFSVSGTHIYNAAGPFAVSVSILDDGGSTQSMMTTAVSTPEPVPVGLAFVGLGLGALVYRARRS